MTPVNPPGKPVPSDQHGRHSNPADGEVHSISNAAVAHSEDMRKRMIQYGLAMGIRLVCLILIFVVDGWFKILMVAGAVFLPWVAVVIANGSDQAQIHSDSLLETAPYVELESPVSQTAEQTPSGSEGSPDGQDGLDSPIILQGEVVPDDDYPEEQEKRAS